MSPPLSQTRITPLGDRDGRTAFSPSNIAVSDGMLNMPENSCKCFTSLLSREESDTGQVRDIPSSQLAGFNGPTNRPVKSSMLIILGLPAGRVLVRAAAMGQQQKVAS